MMKYSIKTAERLSGVKAHTLRVWEQRYGLVLPSRSVRGNQREYSGNELKVLLKIAFLYKHGYKISYIAKLETDAFDEILEQLKEQNSPLTLLKMELKEAIIDFDEHAFESILNSVIAQSGLKDAMIRVVFPLLKQVGMLWLTDKVMPGQEHFASNIVVHKLIRGINEIKLNRVQRSGLVMMLTPEGEHHEIALLFFRYLLLSNGYNTLYIGASASFEVITSFYKKYLPTHILLNFTSNLQGPEIPEYLKSLKRKCPKVQIVVAGAAIRMQTPDIEEVKVLSNEAEMIAFCHNIYG